MAKVPFSKLGLKKIKEDIANVEFNGVTIEVKQYLPLEDKLNLIADAILAASDDNRFYNPVKLEAFATLYIVIAYTNLTFTDTQKKDLAKLFDIIVSNGLGNLIMDNIPKNELSGLMQMVYACADNIYEQMNSAFGIMEGIARDYKNVGENTTQIQEVLSNPENLKLIRDVATKLV